MAINDIYETRVRVATEWASEYLRIAGSVAMASYDTDTMSIRLPNGEVATVASDAVNLLEFQHETILSDSERQDLTFVLGVMFGAALCRNGRLDANLDLVSESLGDQTR